MLPGQAFHRPDCASTGAVCLADGSAGCRPVRRGERGAVVVHVAVAMMGLLAFAALSIDLGSVWVVRAQVQNAADAAALAGGVSLAYVTPDPDVAQAAALAIAQQHQVWGQTLNAAAVTSTVGSCPAGAPAVSGECMNLTVSQGGASGTPLPVFFSRLFTSMTPEVHATASAKVLLGNSTTCMRPLAMPDRWIERHPGASPWTDDDAYDHYDGAGNEIVAPGVADTYSPPSGASALPGMTVSDMVGVEIVRTIADPLAATPLRAGDVYALDLGRPGSEALPDVWRYEENLGSCNGVTKSVDSTAVPFHPHRESYTRDPIDALVASDPRADWDPVSRSVRGSDFVVSPRVIIVALFDPEEFSRQARTTGGAVHVTITNLIGLFLLPSAGEEVRGVIVPTAGLYNSTAPSLGDESAFLRTVALVR